MIRPLSAPLPLPERLSEALEETDGRGIRVGVIDSGWDRSLDLPNTIHPGVGLVDPERHLQPTCTTDDLDRLGHGTACTELILRLAPAAEIFPIRVFGKRLETSPAILRAAITWAVEQGMHLVNLSLGTFRSDAVGTLYRACEAASRRGTTVVASVHAGRSWSYPAAFENVLGVGTDDGLASLYDIRHQPDLAAEFLARGSHPDGLWLDGLRRPVAGTSFSAPIVTALSARLLQRHPGAGLRELRTLLSSISAPGSNVPSRS